VSTESALRLAGIQAARGAVSDAALSIDRAASGPFDPQLMATSAILVGRKMVESGARDEGIRLLRKTANRLDGDARAKVVNELSAIP
jgi:hypothetical protein